MNMLTEELQNLAADPMSWIVVVVLAVLAGFAVTMLTRCPYVLGTADISEAAVSRAQANPPRPGPRFVLSMVAGIALTVSGLFMINYGIKPTLALIALVSGIVVIQTVPPFYHITENRQRLIAGRDAAPEEKQGLQERLRSSYVELARTNVVLLVAVTGALLAF